MTENTRRITLKALILMTVLAAVVFVDQWTKNWTVDVIGNGGDIDLIPGWFGLSYVRNQGAAWGIFQGGHVVLGAVTVVVVAYLVFLYMKTPDRKPYGLMRAAFLLIISGAVGNQLDRFFRGYVVDMFNFYIIQFPVFNVADIAIVVGTGLLLLFFILHGKEAESVFSFRRNAGITEDPQENDGDDDTEPEECHG